MKDDGGYVYPQETGSTHGDGSWIVKGGMTLRDYLMGQIKPAIIQGLMLRYKDVGYTDLAMLNEAHVLAEEEVSKMIKESKI